MPIHFKEDFAGEKITRALDSSSTDREAEDVASGVLSWLADQIRQTVDVSTLIGHCDRDETWGYYYDPVTQRMSMEWARKEQQRPVRWPRRARETWFIVYFGCRGIVPKSKLIPWDGHHSINSKRPSCGHSRPGRTRDDGRRPYRVPRWRTWVSSR